MSFYVKQCLTKKSVNTVLTCSSVCNLWAMGYWLWGSKKDDRYWTDESILIDLSNGTMGNFWLQPGRENRHWMTKSMGSRTSEGPWAPGAAFFCAVSKATRSWCFCLCSQCPMGGKELDLATKSTNNPSLHQQYFPPSPVSHQQLPCWQASKTTGATAATDVLERKSMTFLRSRRWIFVFFAIFLPGEDQWHARANSSSFWPLHGVWSSSAPPPTFEISWNQEVNRATKVHLSHSKMRHHALFWKVRVQKTLHFGLSFLKQSVATSAQKLKIPGLHQKAVSLIDVLWFSSGGTNNSIQACPFSVLPELLYTPLDQLHLAVPVMSRVSSYFSGEWKCSIFISNNKRPQHEHSVEEKLIGNSGMNPPNQDRLPFPT